VTVKKSEIPMLLLSFEKPSCKARGCFNSETVKKKGSLRMFY